MTFRHGGHWYLHSFGGEGHPAEILADQARWGELKDFDGFLKRNSRANREPEIFACAKKLRSEYKKVGVVGYCYGGWAAFRLGAKGNDLVDCVSTGHPSLLTKEDIDAVSVPTQILAPEVDFAYTEELKGHTWKTLQRNKVVFDYQNFPGVEHACLVRGNPKIDGEREAMARGKDAAVSWFKQWLWTCSVILQLIHGRVIMGITLL
jgi:dienelactone hydrolase